MPASWAIMRSGTGGGRWEGRTVPHLKNTRRDEGVRAACEPLLDLLAQRHHRGTGGTGDQALPHNAFQQGNVLPALGRNSPFGAPVGERTPWPHPTIRCAAAGERVLAVVRSASLRAGETSAVAACTAAMPSPAVPFAAGLLAARRDRADRGSLTCPTSPDECGSGTARRRGSRLRSRPSSSPRPSSCVRARSRACP